MKFSLWLEGKKFRSQKTQMKAPKKKSALERQVSDAKQRAHLMAGTGDQKTYGKAGPSDSTKTKFASRAQGKADLRRRISGQDD